MEFHPVRDMMEVSRCLAAAVLERLMPSTPPEITRYQEIKVNRVERPVEREEDL